MEHISPVYHGMCITCMLWHIYHLCVMECLWHVCYEAGIHSISLIPHNYMQTPYTNRVQQHNSPAGCHCQAMFTCFYRPTAVKYWIGRRLNNYHKDQQAKYSDIWQWGPQLVANIRAASMSQSSQTIGRMIKWMTRQTTMSNESMKNEVVISLLFWVSD